jgi:hypothetical protein
MQFALLIKICQEENIPFHPTHHHRSLCTYYLAKSKRMLFIISSFATLKCTEVYVEPKVETKKD